MASVNRDLPLVVITGPTASGKTSLAIKVAKYYGGEIISADSRAIYRGLSVGTAKPTIEEMEGVPHWGIDIVNPDERFTATDFKRYSEKKISEIRSRGHLPILVGGTGLYIYSIIYDYQFNSASNDIKRRNKLMMKSLNYLYEYCNKNNIKLPENKMNKRYVVNNILRNGQNYRDDNQLIDNVIVVGISTDKLELRNRIAKRANSIFSTKTIAEAKTVAMKYGWNNEAMTGNIYPVIHNFINGYIDSEEALRQCITLDWRLAKRQLTWLKRSKHIKWLTLSAAYSYFTQELDSL